MLRFVFLREKIDHMIKGETVINNQIVDKQTNEMISKVKDIIFNPETNQVVAFFLKQAKDEWQEKVLPWSGIDKINNQFIVAHSVNMVVRLDELFELKKLLQRQLIRKGMSVITADNHNLGKVQDIYFDENNGFIKGYEVSGGTWAKSKDHSIFIPLPFSVQIQDDVAYIPSSKVAKLEII